MVIGRSPEASGAVSIVSLTLHSFWIVLIVSPPFPITRPTLSLGTLISSVTEAPFV
jgi:hypothetical protein